LGEYLRKLLIGFQEFEVEGGYEGSSKSEEIVENEKSNICTIFIWTEESYPFPFLQFLF